MQRVPGPDSRRLPSAPARERFSHYEQGARDAGAAGFVALLAAALFLLILAVSCQQATERDEALTLLRSGIATLTEVDLVLEERRDELRQIVEATNDETLTMPGYPLDVPLTRAEALNASNADLREIILTRSALLVYEHGVDAFDRTGSQSIGTFSSQGMLQTLVGQLSETTNRRAEIASLIFLALTALAAILVVVRSDGLRKVRNPGLGALLAGLAGLAFVTAGRFLAGLFGGDDAFFEELRDIFGSLADVPFRNFLVVTVLGAFLVVLSPLLSLLAHAVPAFGYAPAAEPSFDAGGFDEEIGFGDDFESFEDFDERDDFEDEADFDERWG